jgi:hypothetical protein
MLLSDRFLWQYVDIVTCRELIIFHEYQATCMLIDRGHQHFRVVGNCENVQIEDV